MPTNNPKPDQITQGVILILASVFAMGFADAIVKLMSSDLTVWQIFVSRSLFAVICLTAFAYVSKKNLKPQNLTWVIIRSALLVFSWLALYASFPILDLSIAAVVVYTNPILTVLLSAVLLKERVSLLQWGGVLLGFIGVVIILNPGSDSFSWFILLPLLAAAFYSLAMILTRSKCQSEGAVSLSLALHCSLIITGLIAIGILTAIDLDTSTKASYPFLFESWVTMGLKEWALMALLGVLFAGYATGTARAYQIAPPQIIATFDYGYLISAIIWGFLFFSEKLELRTIIGMILITLAGIIVARQSSK